MRLYVLLLILSTPGVAQQLSQVGRFSAEYSRGCAPMTINLTVEDAFGDITRQYFFEGEGSQTIDTFHTYTEPGRYQIVQIVGLDVDPKTDTLDIEVFAPVNPAFQISICENNEVGITIDDSGYDQYLVTFTDTDQQVISRDLLQMRFTYSDQGLKEITIEGQYLDGLNNCGASSQFVFIDSFENRGNLDQIDLTRNCIDRISATITTTLDPFQDYQLQFSEDGQNFQTIADLTFPTTQQHFNDLTNSSNDALYFRLDAISSCTNQQFPGEVLQLENPNAVIPSLDNAYVSWVESGIQFMLDGIAVGEYTARRRVPGFDWKILDTLFNGYIDPYVSDFREYEYEVSFADTCGNSLPSVMLAPAFVSFIATNINTYEISWLPPINTLQESFTHRLMINGNGNNVVLDNPRDQVELFLTEPQGSNQLLTLETLYETDTLRSNSRTLFYEFRAYLPDAFTPNNDGLNDFINIIGITANEVDFKVFNRWGEIIHRSTTPNLAWDGKVRGELAAEGQYYYQLTFLSIENKRIQQQGSFALLRK